MVLVRVDLDRNKLLRQLDDPFILEGLTVQLLAPSSPVRIEIDQHELVG